MHVKCEKGSCGSSLSTEHGNKNLLVSVLKFWLSLVYKELRILSEICLQRTFFLFTEYEVLSSKMNNLEPKQVVAE